mgnify:CR=1 FL=1
MKLDYKDCGNIGFTCSTFDLLHAGHVVMLEEAKRHCDKFLVFLHKDPSLHRKSKYKPVIPLYDRYKAKESEALCNIQMYFREGVGVADHPNVVDTVDKLFEDYAEATEHLKLLKENRYEFVGQ